MGASACVTRRTRLTATLRGGARTVHSPHSSQSTVKSTVHSKSTVNQRTKRDNPKPKPKQETKSNRAKRKTKEQNKTASRRNNLYGPKNGIYSMFLCLFFSFSIIFLLLASRRRLNGRHQHRRYPEPVSEVEWNWNGMGGRRPNLYAYVLGCN
jgi:hypothetical protein